MDTPAPSPGDWKAWRLALFAAAAFVLTGAVVSVIAGSWKVHSEDYLSIDYHRLAFLVFRDTVNSTVFRLAAIGISVAFLILLFSRWRIGRRAVDLLQAMAGFDERGKWAILSAGGIVAGLLSGAYQPLISLFAGVSTVTPSHRSAAYLATAAASVVASCVAFVLWRRRLSQGNPERIPRILLAVWITVGGTMWIATRVNHDYLPGILSPKSIAANLFFGVAMLVLVAPIYWLRGPAMNLVREAGRPGRLTHSAQAAGGLSFVAALIINAPFFSAPDLEGKPNILLVSIDTLRADHVSCYGYERETTPNIDALAARGIRFDNAVSASTWTLSSHATMLSGLFPSTHGALLPDDKIPASVCLVSETLRQEGYRTGAVVSGYFVTDWYRFEQGFEFFDESNAPDSMTKVSSPGVTDTALDWLNGIGNDPFFLLVHYFDPHSDFLYHTEFDYLPDYEGPIRGGEEFIDLRDRRNELTPADVKKLIALYDGEINVTDRQLGRLFAEIDRMGMGENLLVLLTSDHGEEFMEHGWLGHRVHLYDPTIHVPLIVTWRKRIAPGQVVEMPVSQTDLAPAILETAGVAVPWWYQTDSLWNLLGMDVVSGSPPAVAAGDAEVDSDRAVFTEVSFDAGPGSHEEARAFKTGIRTRRWKLIHEESTDTFECYDLAVDPGETDNVVDGTPEVPMRLRRDWRELCEKAGRAPFSPDSIGRPSLSETEIENLKSIGYF